MSLGATLLERSIKNDDIYERLIMPAFVQLSWYCILACLGPGKVHFPRLVTLLSKHNCAKHCAQNHNAARPEAHPAEQVVHAFDVGTHLFFF